jgi:hypothetical protein
MSITTPQPFLDISRFGTGIILGVLLYGWYKGDSASERGDIAILFGVIVAIVYLTNQKES